MTTSGLFQVRKSGEMSKTSTQRPVSHKLVIDIDVDSDTAAESDLSLLKPVHSWTEWMTDCERCWTVLQKTQCKTLTNVLWFGECLCLRQWKHLYSWERITQTMYIPSKIQENIFLESRCSRYLNSWYWKNRLRFLECLRSAGKVLHGNSYLWSMLKKSSVSFMQRFMYSQILCYVSERWIRAQHQILFGSDSWNGSKIHHNTELLTQSTENRWNSSGIFPQIHYIGACPWRPKVHEQNGRTRTIPRTNYLHVDVQWHHVGEIKTMRRNVLLIPHLWLFSQKDFQQDVGHSSDLGQKWSGIPLTKKGKEENEVESLKWWWSDSEKADTQFSEQRVRSLEERSKAKEVDNYSYTSVPMVIRLKLFFAQSFLSISSVSTEHSQICVKSTVSVKQAQEDLLRQNNPTHSSRQQTSS